jgi:hypothetical protein
MPPLRPPALLPRVFTRSVSDRPSPEHRRLVRRTAPRETVHRGALGQPFGVKRNDGSRPPRRSGLQMNYYVDNTDAHARKWAKSEAYPVGNIKADQVIVLRSLSRHLTPEDFWRTVPRNLRPYLRGMPPRACRHSV